MTQTLNLPKYELRKVRPQDTTIDRAVQRDEGIDWARVKREAARFNPSALGVLILSERLDGSFVVLDGMHRIEFAKAAGWDQPLDAIVFHDLTVEEEAGLFLLYNNKKDPSAMSRFKARVVTRNEVAVEIDRIIHENGWEVNRNGAPGSLAAVDAAERVFRTGAGALPEGEYNNLLDQVLATITAAWGLDPAGVHQHILSGMGMFYARFWQTSDAHKLVRELRGVTPKTLLADARAARGNHKYRAPTMPASVALQLTDLHNRNKRGSNRLDWRWTR